MAVPVTNGPHPLAELSQPEFLQARDAVIKIHGASQPLFFRAVYLQEPAKAELLPFLNAEHSGTLTDSTPRPIRAASVEYDVLLADAQVFHRAVVNVTSGKIVSNQAIPRANNAFPHFNVYGFSTCSFCACKCIADGYTAPNFNFSRLIA